MPHHRMRTATLQQIMDGGDVRKEQLGIFRCPARCATRLLGLITSYMEERRIAERLMHLGDKIPQHRRSCRVRQAPVPAACGFKERLALRVVIQRNVLSPSDASRCGMSKDVDLRHQRNSCIFGDCDKMSQLLFRHLAALQGEPRMFLALEYAP